MIDDKKVLEAIKIIDCYDIGFYDLSGEEIPADKLADAFDMAIEALTNEWTPITVSEPNTSDHVLVTYKWCDDDYETSELDYWVTKHEAENGNEKCKRLIDHVIAWRRMPDPYKEGE